MANNRIYYAIQQVRLGDTTNIEEVHGLQTIGMTTNFNLEQVFELGQLEIYENIEGTPDVEVTLEKVLDGYPLIYHMASSGDVAGTANSGIAARSKARCDVRLGVFDEADNNIAGQDATVEVYMSGMYVSNLSYNFATDGNFTESVTLVGNNKVWLKRGDATDEPQMKMMEVSNIKRMWTMPSHDEGNVNELRRMREIGIKT